MSEAFPASLPSVPHLAGAIATDVDPMPAGNGLSPPVGRLAHMPGANSGRVRHSLEAEHHRFHGGKPASASGERPSAKRTQFGPNSKSPGRPLFHNFHASAPFYMRAQKLKKIAAASRPFGSTVSIQKATLASSIAIGFLSTPNPPQA